MTNPTKSLKGWEKDLNHMVFGEWEECCTDPEYQKLETFISDLLDKARRDLIKDINDKNFEYMEDCEPDCTSLRHAYHQGSWDHYWKMDKYLSKLSKE